MSSESERESASSGTLDTRVMFPLILAWFWDDIKELFVTSCASVKQEEEAP